MAETDQIGTETKKKMSARDASQFAIMLGILAGSATKRGTPDDATRYGETVTDTFWETLETFGYTIVEKKGE